MVKYTLVALVFLLGCSGDDSSVADSGSDATSSDAGDTGAPDVAADVLEAGAGPDCSFSTTEFQDIGNCDAGKGIGLGGTCLQESPPALYCQVGCYGADPQFKCGGSLDCDQIHTGWLCCLDTSLTPSGACPITAKLQGMPSTLATCGATCPLARTLCIADSDCDGGHCDSARLQVGTTSLGRFGLCAP